MQPVIYAADIGSVAHGRFGWARVDSARNDVDVERGGSAEIAALVDAVADDLGAGRPVALGFECPLFVPVPGQSVELGKSRPGEGSHAFSAAAGAGALVTGLVEAAWVLRELRKHCRAAIAFLDWTDFVGAGGGLFLWEAFVSGSGKGISHVDDARLAAAAFRAALPNPLGARAVDAPSPLSLIGAVLLWSGWSQDLNVLRQPCLVIKPGPPASVKVPVGKAGRRARSGISPKVNSTDRQYDWVIRVTKQIPRGRWTEYGLIANIIAGDPETSLTPIAQGVGGELKKDPGIPNAHRVLNAGGLIPDQYPYRRDLLEDEGVRFSNGRAAPEQRWPTPGV